MLYTTIDYCGSPGTQGILPSTEEERTIINELSTAHFEQILENPDERLCEEMVNPPPIDPNVTLPSGNCKFPINVPLPPLQTDRDSDEPECPRPVSTEPRTCCKSSCVLVSLTEYHLAVTA